MIIFSIVICAALAFIFFMMLVGWSVKYDDDEQKDGEK